MATVTTVARPAIWKHRGSAKTCKTVVRADLDVTLTTIPLTRSPWRETRATYKGHQPCPDCGKDLWAEQIKGTKTDQPCGAKCLASKGPTCECSCGGANHGANHTH